MAHLLPDGRRLMAASSDIRAFFDDCFLTGREIADIYATRGDYGIANLDEIVDVENARFECAVETDGEICLIFTDGQYLSIEFGGEGPVLLAFGDTAPREETAAYPLRAVFRPVLGRRIGEVVTVADGGELLFPAYRGIDMSDESDGVCAICLRLDDGSSLFFHGSLDFFVLEHKNADGSWREFSWQDIAPYLGT